MAITLYSTMAEEVGDIEMKVEETTEAKPEDVAMTNDDGAKKDVKLEDQDDGAKNGDGDDNKDKGDSSTSDEDEEVEAPEPLATTRARRANAGNRMSDLIQEEEDEFYTNVYGGFQEEDDDGDFDDEQDVNDEEVEDDYSVDSDFDIDESDEIAPEHQAVDEEPKRKRGVYKDPKPRVPASSHMGPSSSTPVQPRPKPSSSVTPQSPSKHRPERSFRDSTKKKTAETIKNVETIKKKKKKLRRLEAPKKLTQEEMLEEAKITEEENIKSLEIYQRLESEKLKKIKLMKKTLPVPYVTYYSSVFTNPETKERYSRNLCTYVGCEPNAKNSKTALRSKT